MGTRVKLPSLFPLPLSPRGSQLHHRTSRFPLPHVRGRGPQQETRFKFRIPPGRTAPLPPEGRGHMGQTAEPSLVRGPGGAEPHMPYRWRKRQGAGAGAYGPGEVAPGLATRAPGASCACRSGHRPPRRYKYPPLPRHYYPTHRIFSTATASSTTTTGDGTGNRKDPNAFPLRR